MDAQHHATIADKLMQYRGKLPKHTNPSNRIAVGLTYDLKKHIEDLLWYIEKYADAESKGLIWWNVRSVGVPIGGSLAAVAFAGGKKND